METAGACHGRPSRGQGLARESCGTQFGAKPIQKLILGKLGRDR